MSDLHCCYLVRLSWVWIYSDTAKSVNQLIISGQVCIEAIAADCKSVTLIHRRFDSYLDHLYYYYKDLIEIGK